MNKHVKWCSTSLATGGIQFKATLRYHYTSITMAKTNVTKPNADNDAEKLDHSCIVSGNAKMVQFLIKLNINYNTTQKLYHWALISEK